jgi:hypothetical protein
MLSPVLWICIGFDADPEIRIQSFDDRKYQNFTAQKNPILIQKINLFLPTEYAPMKGVQATGEAFTLKREHPVLQNMKSYFFLFSWVIFCPLPTTTLALNYGYNTKHV